MPVARQFLEFALQCGALAFGDFTTRSGRRTPYFFDAGRFDRGSTLGKLARFYAQSLLQAQDDGRIQFDMLFGPAYKGIALASATAVALAGLDRDVAFAYNRKERKDHGEGGELIGAALRGRVMIVDDVITDGAAKREAIELIRAHGAEPAGVVIMLDRMERTGADGALSDRSAVGAFEQATGVPVISIARLDDLLALLRSDSPLAATASVHLASIEAYRRRYGA
ncbi:MAG TPA: orotate phosphoribosyltransferase [Burkholderiaceae bacterium]|jgi:orotate phosphoribosyltransferase|nr:orotate phosphoribosyltransferase [Burkholderiaceae bacterium]